MEGGAEDSNPTIILIIRMYGSFQIPVVALDRL